MCSSFLDGGYSADARQRVRDVLAPRIPAGLNN
jgi:hypothetical protein